MYQAKIVGKREELGRLIIDVEFSDGVNPVIEQISPDSKDQFHSWVAGRLYSLNSTEELKGETAVDQVVDPNPTPVLTQEEVDFRTWQRKLNRLYTVQTLLINTGVLTGTEPAVVNLRNDLKTTLKPTYIDKL